MYMIYSECVKSGRSRCIQYHRATTEFSQLLIHWTCLLLFTL